VLTYLKGRVAGLTITGSSSPGGSMSATWRGSKTSIFLNEMPVDIDQLTSVSMTDVAYVKVFNPPFFGAFGGGAGAALQYIQKRAVPGILEKPGYAIKTCNRLCPEKEFYSPNYGTFDSRNQNEDVRSTLYWNPMVITTTKNHTIRLPFYNNDITTSFRVIVEGVDNNGRLIHIEKLLE
jgi:hypothetical protein